MEISFIGTETQKFFGGSKCRMYIRNAVFTLFWRSKQELQEGTSESAQPVPERNDPESDPGDSGNSESEAECSTETASERKL